MKYWLHFIGNRLYGIKRFIAEARRLGVQRAVPFHQLKHFRYNDVVLLATYNKIEDEDVAHVFGYFRITGLVYNLEEANEKLLEKLDIVKTVDCGGKTETRACGSYCVGSAYIVNDDLPEIYEKAKETCKEAKVDPNKYKWFLKGPLIVLDEPVILRGQKFFRGYRQVEIEGLEIPKPSGESRYLIWIYDYKQRKYLPKRERDRLDHVLLDEFITIRR